MTDQSDLEGALSGLAVKPADSAAPATKKRYSELMSEAIAQSVAAALRRRGLGSARPSPPGVSGVSGAERRMAGGIGDKKVDVTWATEEAGLLVAFSVKCINFRDGRTKNFQKNFTNRRGDMLFEAVTLHRRFPYSVLVGLFVFDKGAASDDTARRRSTFENAHRGLRLFTGRDDPAGRDEQYERFYVGLTEATSQASEISFSAAGEPRVRLDMDAVLDEILDIVVERNSDRYQILGGQLARA